jgi:hypothetical protein
VEVALAELDLQLHAGEERRGWMEDEPVRARVEVVAEARAAVSVGPRLRDESAAEM